MRVIVDSREQLPYCFDKYQVEIVTSALPAGDYSLIGFESQIAVERKTLDDLIACLMNSNRARFERELTKLRNYDLAAVVVEASLLDVSRGNYRSRMNSHSALQSIVAFQVRYRVPFVWAGNRAGGEYMTFSLLSKYLREIEQARAAKVQAVCRSELDQL